MAEGLYVLSTFRPKTDKNVFYSYDITPTCCPEPFDTAAAIRALPADIFAVKVGDYNQTNLLQIVGGDASRIYTPRTAIAQLMARIYAELPAECAATTNAKSP